MIKTGYTITTKIEKSRIPNYRISHTSETSMHEKTKRKIPGKKITSYWSQDGNLFYIKSGSHVKQMIKSY